MAVQALSDVSHGLTSIFLIGFLIVTVYVLADAERLFSGVRADGRAGIVRLSDGTYATDTQGSFLSGKTTVSSKVDAGGSFSFPTTASLLYDYLDHAGHLSRLESMVALQPSSFALLTAKAQRMIFDWQHPPSCFGRKYVVSQGNDPLAGIGSHIHIASHHFAVAMELGAILVWADNVAHIYTDPETCDGGSAAQNLECFFLPPSNCTLQDAFAPENTRVDLRFGDAGESAGFGYKFYHVPHQFQSLWESSGLPVARSWNTGQQDHVKYWFRGQVAAYFMRPNALTSAAFRELRTVGGGEGGSPPEPVSDAVEKSGGAKDYLVTAAGPDSPLQASVDLRRSFPLPPGVISLHIRHGDKGVEMALVPTEAYLQAAAVLVKAQPLALARRSIFMSTEDPGAITESKSVLEKGEVGGFSHWSLSWYDVPRANSNGPEQLNAFSLPRGKLTRIWLLQLLIALECDAWVGTRGSNWNRLIDELRCIWVPKCANDFSEVGDFNKWEK